MHENIRIANNKLSRKIIEKLIAPTVIVSKEYKREDGLMDTQFTEIPNIKSKYSISLLIELSKRQNSIGQVTGVHYKEFCHLLGCNKNTFYNCLDELNSREYIQTSSDKNGYWTIFIHNNVFTKSEDDHKGYLDTNISIFNDERYKKFSLTSKKICLYILLNAKRYSEYSIYPETLCKRLGIKVINVIKVALKQVQIFFQHEFIQGKQGGLIRFTSISYAQNDDTECFNFFRHKLKFYCQTHKIKTTPDEIKKVSVLFCSYRHKLSFTKIFKVFGEYFLNHNSIQPALINSLLGLSANEYAKSLT